MKKAFLLCLILCFSFVYSFVSFANLCESIFNKESHHRSRLSFDYQAIQRAKNDQDRQPNFFDLAQEHVLVNEWNKRLPVPSLLTALLPKDVYFINHQQYKPESSTVVKSAEMGNAIMVRAHWRHKKYSFDSNVVFSIRALVDNKEFHQKRNWLASERANAVIFYFHGGGTTTTGAHTVHNMLNHFKKYGIDVIAVDLPWHGEGHRQLLNNFEMEIEVLGAFAQKFIPHNVPVFVAGHSWGGAFAEQIMRMSDRPKSEFHFHPKLTGAIIMSTPITDLHGINSYFAKKAGKESSLSEVVGGGKTLKEATTANSSADLSQVIRERQEGVNRLTREALVNRVVDFPRDEHDIFNGMIMDGKISLLGGIYANIMFQMSQAMPAHRGKDYIPALMIVGKHDPLVYLGLEKPYEIYKELENITPIYLEELPLITNKEVWDKTGHLLANRGHGELQKEEQNNSPVHFLEIQQFISEVLKSKALKDAENNITQLKTSAPSADATKEQVEAYNIKLQKAESIRDTILNTPHYLSIEAERRINQLEKSSPPPNATQKQKQAYKNKKREAEKRRESDINIPGNTPNIVYIIQNYANLLSFREFLSEYTLIQITKTNRYVEYIQRKPELIKEIQEALRPYSPKAVVNQFLNKVRQLDSSNLESIKQESQFLVDSVFINYIENQQLGQDLKQLDQQLSNLASSFSKQDFQNVSQLATALLTKKHKEWLKPNKTKRFPNTTSLVLKAETLTSAIENLKTLRLPHLEYEKVKQLLTEYHVAKNMTDEKYRYIPTWDEVQSSGIKEGREEKVEEILKKIETTVQSQKKFIIENKETDQKIKELSKENNTLLNQEKKGIKHHISVVGKWLATANTNPPNSLRAEYENSELQFQQLLLAHTRMEEAVGEPIGWHLFGTARPLKHSEILPVLRAREEDVKNFRELFTQYIQNKRELVRKTILAMEAGEMGSEARESVIALYGRGSDGIKPQIGSNSSYLEFIENTKKLAKSEALKYTNQNLIVAEQDTYNNLMNQLNNYLDNPSPAISQASNLFNTSKTKVSEVILSGKKDQVEGDIHTLRGREKAMQVLKENTAIFNHVIKSWGDLKSALPPPLLDEKQAL